MTRQAIYKSAMEFWLERGVDGFRVDTVNMYSKGEMVDAPITDPGSEWQFAGYQYCNGPRMGEFLEEMNEVLARYDAMTVGECPHTPDMSRVVKYVSAKEKQLNMVFQFVSQPHPSLSITTPLHQAFPPRHEKREKTTSPSLLFSSPSPTNPHPKDVVDIGQGPYKFQTTPKNYTLPQLKRAIATTQSLLRLAPDAWTTVFLENHDQARSITRFTSDAPSERTAGGKLLSLMMCALSGTLFIYQGQELGMTNFPASWDMSEYKDVDSSNYYAMVASRSHNDPAALAAAKASLQHLARDHARVPMSWSTAPHNGFSPADCGATPWMRALEDAEACNARQQAGDKDSVLSFWKKMLGVRRAHNDLLVHGEFDDLDVENERLFVFTKTWMGRKALAVCNFTGEPQAWDVPGEVAGRKRELLVSSLEREDGGELGAWEGRVYLLS